MVERVERIRPIERQGGDGSVAAEQDCVIHGRVMRRMGEMAKRGIGDACTSARSLACVPCHDPTIRRELRAA
jgi:hypothetical protein